MTPTILNTGITQLAIAALVSMTLVGCSDSSEAPANENTNNGSADVNTGSNENTNDGSTDLTTSSNENTEGDSTELTAASVEGINFDHFLAGSILGDVTEVDCVLSNGLETRCYQFDVIGEPLDHTPGPYCPRNIADGPETSGKWLDNGNLVDLDGAYIAGLEQRYGPGWLLYDEQTGMINVTDTAESCLAAAQLNPPEQWWNYCIECTIDGVGGAVPIQHTIPIVPVAREEIVELDNTFPGVSLNGVGLSFPADIDGIIATFNIAALDDCGGHVNNAISYHYHAATGCWHEIAQADEHAALIGYAMDGYGIYSMTNLDGGEPTDLDECRGHTDEARGYHYHVAGPGENKFIGCFRGEIVPVQADRPGGNRPPRSSQQSDTVAGHHGHQH